MIISDGLECTIKCVVINLFLKSSRFKGLSIYTHVNVQLCFDVSCVTSSNYPDGGTELDEQKLEQTKKKI